ncbi:MAG: hypothetical protein AMXMBFR33_63920 [Candidatus Xenobia bacterium]
MIRARWSSTDDQIRTSHHASRIVWHSPGGGAELPPPINQVGLAGNQAGGPGAIACLMVEVDHFDRLNERLGPTDHCGHPPRFGGEEFVIILSSTDGNAPSPNWHCGQDRVAAAGLFLT